MQLDQIIFKSKEISSSNDKDVLFSNVKKYAEYFKTHQNEFYELKLEDLGKLETIEEIASKATSLIPLSAAPFASDTLQILAFNYLIINKIYSVSHNEVYVEKKMSFINQQPWFLLFVFKNEAKNELKQLKLFNTDEDYFVKVVELLAAQIVVTSFVKNRQTLLYNHSYEQVSRDYFYPITLNSIKDWISKVDDVLHTIFFNLL